MANVTSGSFSLAAWKSGLGLASRKYRPAAAATGAKAANLSPRFAHKRYVKAPPLEWPVAYLGTKAVNRQSLDVIRCHAGVKRGLLVQISLFGSFRIVPRAKVDEAPANLLGPASGGMREQRVIGTRLRGFAGCRRTGRIVFGHELHPSDFVAGPSVQWRTAFPRRSNMWRVSTGVKQ